MVDSALNAMIVSEEFGVKPPCVAEDRKIALVVDEIDNVNADVRTEQLQTLPTQSLKETCLADLEAVGILHDDLLSGKTTISQACDSEVLARILEQLETKKQSMKDSRTATLWLQFMKMMQILRKFLKGERLGIWDLHVQAMYEMLPYLAASGHNLYTKSLHIYLQYITKLPETSPEVFRHFNEGLHVVRRSDRLWAGLSADLVIEQVLMRSI